MLKEKKKKTAFVRASTCKTIKWNETIENYKIANKNSTEEVLKYVVNLVYLTT